MHRENGGLFLSCKCRFVLCSAQTNTAVVNMELWVLQKGILVALVLAGLDARALEFGSCLGTEVKCCERLCASFCGSAPSLEPCTRNGALQGALHQQMGAAGRPAPGDGCCKVPCCAPGSRSALDMLGFLQCGSPVPCAPCGSLGLSGSPWDLLTGHGPLGSVCTELFVCHLILVLIVLVILRHLGLGRGAGWELVCHAYRWDLLHSCAVAAFGALGSFQHLPAQPHQPRRSLGPELGAPMGIPGSREQQPCAFPPRIPLGWDPTRNPDAGRATLGAQQIPGVGRTPSPSWLPDESWVLLRVLLVFYFSPL
ncbi:uncharacterized protein LOC128074735 [Tympanuchus pallidicinctus]|uniref:uncharacterized protein LOC128074735 n=1 Tax=Tympanuchus pallidicinctus TaxID=109042 RepID=UPI00228733EB|nr:uncharacterized protein LOC128074735 [Tympanuchus pallidicinctus]